MVGLLARILIGSLPWYQLVQGCGLDNCRTLRPCMNKKKHYLVSYTSACIKGLSTLGLFNKEFKSNMGKILCKLCFLVQLTTTFMYFGLFNY